MLRHVDPNLELVSCGFESDWNRRLMHTLRNHLGFVDHLSIHRYWGSAQSDFHFDSEGYYGLLKEANRTEAFVQETRAIIQEVAGRDTKIGIALDEWGAWHPEATLASQYEQRSTLRDAMAVAVAFEGFHRQCASLSMANLAQICNVLHAPIQTLGPDLWMTPTYYMFQLHRHHLGAQAHRSVWETEDASPGLTKVGVMATSKDDLLAVTITNRHMEQPVELIVENVTEVLEARFLAGSNPHAMNGPTESEVLPNALHWAETGDGSITFALPPHSACTVRYKGVQ
jgi:alpha-N-arabinofuranosidase